MLPYFIVLVLVIFWVALENASLKRKSFWLPLLILSIFSGIRNYSVGTDSPGYTRMFRDNFPISDYTFSEHVEPGYQLLRYFLLSLTHNYFWLFFTTTLIIVGSYLFTIKRLSTNYTLSVFFFITLGAYTFSFNGLRQGIAVAIMALAAPYLIQKNFRVFLLIALIASAFHSTALILLPFYFLLHWKIKLPFKATGIFLTTLLISSTVISYLAANNPRYEVYTEETKAGGLVVLSFNIFIVIALYLVNYLYKIRDNNFHLLLQFYSLGVVFVIPFAILGTNPSGPQRMLNYFSWLIVILLPIALKKVNNIIIYLIAIMLSLVYFGLTTSTFSHLTPYTLNPIFEIL